MKLVLQHWDDLKITVQLLDAEMFNTLLPICTVLVLVNTAEGFCPGVKCPRGFASTGDCLGVNVRELGTSGS